MANAPIIPAPADPVERPPVPAPRLTTGAKLVLVLGSTLLILAAIAVFATLQTTRLADSEASGRLRIAANEDARAIATELVGDMTALRVAVRALGQDPLDMPSCARAQGVFAQQSMTGARFLITDRTGKTLCGDPLPAALPVLADGSPIGADILAGQGLVLSVVHQDGRTQARAFFPLPFLRTLIDQSNHTSAVASVIELDGESLPLAILPGRGALARMKSIRTELGIGGLVLRTSAPSAPITSSLIVALALPLLMWLAAVVLGWFIVDRLLIRPLRQLRGIVAAYQPGETLDISQVEAAPAQEIRDLADTFEAITQTVATHEAGLAEGLVRQTKLTREVHHRVKNNLQVISSLINFHARGATGPEAMAAYSSIQRRVDALAVVHRHHFAELEENRGLNLRTMIGELAANIRATAPENAAGIGISLDVAPLLVNQDVAVAVAFLVTETIELAMNCDPAAQIRVAVKPAEQEGRAVVRVVSRALVETDELRHLIGKRYGRVMEGLARQLRAPLHHDPLTGAYEISIAIVGRD
ncbi:MULTISPECIES: histidine kinase dimerization/phosphoacceptor domain -containing protein [unclassified Sphingomonas]|uniref:sensor histidine kinase n=1 Tax=unclassified Sphingomonas TaxID=196159 RepID=UPI002863C9DB|nr:MULTISPECIES: histidine kinase dimerization/phosphoacceptor domain -containing protein [unclassified Sphingomonas]MDR6113349.1 two-component sensor histidine kinase [Sphingomonas sp. SORGH_AS_0789]MDR6149290.1 two-component sensor histidine kinase [Sphingomonas sp. SORGH_AS_0742]